MKQTFDRFAARSAAVMGSVGGFCTTIGFTMACLLLGPVIGWVVVQILLTTALTVLTQLTAMLIQRATAKQETALQAKVDEIIRAIPEANNQLRGIEEQE